jgi:hypothetical protein
MHIISSKFLSWTCALTWSTSNHIFLLRNDVVLKLNVNAHTTYILQDMLLIGSTFKWSFIGSHLEYNLGLHFMYMDKPFKYDSMQILVHRNCRQLQKPHMGLHALSLANAVSPHWFVCDLFLWDPQLRFPLFCCLCQGLICSTFLWKGWSYRTLRYVQAHYVCIFLSKVESSLCIVCDYLHE